MSESPRVTHVSQYFARRSEAWLYDIVTLPGRFAADVVCETRMLPDEFPFEAVRQVLPTSRRYRGEWFTRQFNRRTPLRTKPHNYWRRALRALDVKADVVHAHFGPTGWMAVDAGLAPVVTSFYGYDATVADVLTYWGLRYSELFANGALFLVEGPAMGGRLERLGAPGERVRVLPLMVDVGSMPWHSPALDGAIRVLMAGRFLPKKGFDHGIEAFARTCRGTGAILTIMGEGPEEPALRDLAARSGVTEQVQFLPFGSREEFHRRLAASDVILQPSRTATNGDSEGGAPVVLLDAQALGPVIVASNHDDLPFVLDSEASYLFPEGDLTAFTDTLCAAIDDRSSWGERSRLARRHVEAQHGRDSVARCRDRIYAEAAGLDS